MGAFVTSILIGAISKGVNKPTVLVVNGSLSLGIALILGSLSTVELPQDIFTHLSILLSLMVGLMVVFNWFLAQVGIESVENQNKYLKLS